MEYPQDGGATWKVKACRLKGDYVEEIKSLPVKSYNPFTEAKGLYLSFASLHENDSNEIFKFISDYGFLGLFLNSSDPAEKIAGYAASRESLSEIKKEIILMKCLINIWIAMKNDDRDSMIDHITHLYIYDPAIEGLSAADSVVKGIKEKLSNESDEVIRYNAAEKLSEWIYRGLRNVNPVLKYDLSSNSFSESWQASNLLSIMYVMFYTDLVQGITLRKCHNKTCNNYFPVYSDDRKIYCSESCARSQAQREYRRRKKSEDKK